MLIVALPVALSHKVRIDDRPQIHYVRGVGAELARTLSATARLAILDPSDDEFYETMIRYEFHRGATIVARISAYSKATPETIARTLSSRAASHVSVHFPNPMIETASSTILSMGASSLLSHAGDAWKVDRSWPYPGFDVPAALAE